MKRLIAIMQVLVLCLVLSACEIDSVSVVSDSPGSNTSTTSPLLPTELSSEPPQLPDHQEEYVLSYPITIGGNRTLVLKLVGKKLSEEYSWYGIGEIQVFDGEHLLQTIMVSDAILAEWGEDIDYNGYTKCMDKDGGLTTTDLNFDGSEDIGLVGWITAGANIPSYYWLWNAQKEQFEYAFCLCNLEVDRENHQLISFTTVGVVSEKTDFYEYDSNGILQNVKREVKEIVDFGEGQTVTTRVYELINGSLQIVT